MEHAINLVCLQLYELDHMVNAFEMASRFEEEALQQPTLDRVALFSVTSQKIQTIKSSLEDIEVSIRTGAKP